MFNVSLGSSSLVTIILLLLLTTSVASLEGCAAVSSASSAWRASHPTPTPGQKYEVAARDAQACIRSVPIVKENATAVLDGLEAYWTFHSTQAWLKDPPSSYPVPGIDLLIQLGNIRTGVQNGTFTSELAFQAAIQNLVNKVADGHFVFKMDLLNVFQFNHHSIGPIAAVSKDGVSLPLSYYTFSDLAVATPASGSAIVAINGISPADYLESFRSTALFADADAQLAFVLGDLAKFDGLQYQGIFADGTGGLYYGNETSLTFANGTTRVFLGTASSTKDFTGVDSGIAFYKKFCSPNVTPEQAIALLGNQSEASPVPANPRPHFPYTKFMDKAGTIAGYFLNGTDDDTAVLSVFNFATGLEGSQDAQETMSNFLKACKDASKTRLIIDLSSNNGGNSLLPFDFMRQLFPTIAPYNVQTARAHPGYNLIGSLVSQEAASIRGSSAVNMTQLTSIGGYSSFDVASFTSPNGSSITWPELYGPQQSRGDNFTNLFGRQYFNPIYSELAGSIVVSGYGNRSSLPAQPFQSQNMILLSNGACDSACALFAHFLKYQGKVKQIAIGGRPQPGPMQAVGGTRGTQVEPFSDLLKFAFGLSQQAPKEVVQQAMSTALGPILQKGLYTLTRARDLSSAYLNFYNHIARGDESLTPLQFTYEAADCRIFYTARTAVDAGAGWARVAEVWKGGFAQCVAGSTGHPTSLSGNPRLYAGGVPSNDSSSSDVLLPGQSPVPSSAGARMVVGLSSGLLAIVGAAVVVLL